MAGKYKLKAASGGKFMFNVLAERKAAKDDSPYLVLKAENGQTIGKSEMYSSNSAMEDGIASAKANGASGTVDEA